ncbi:MAG TPA: hypothetical protein VNS29_15245 [Burkholderiaceae bacterium]|nr:hypothetical protein [Burkholderiaceae bacterium]
MSMISDLTPDGYLVSIAPNGARVIDHGPSTGEQVLDLGAGEIHKIIVNDDIELVFGDWPILCFSGRSTVARRCSGR